MNLSSNEEQKINYLRNFDDDIWTSDKHYAKLIEYTSLTRSLIIEDLIVSKISNVSASTNQGEVEQDHELITPRSQKSFEKNINESTGRLQAFLGNPEIQLAEKREILRMVEIIVTVIKRLLKLQSANQFSDDPKKIEEFEYWLEVWHRLLCGDGRSRDRYARDGLFYVIHNDKRPADPAFMRLTMVIKEAFIGVPHRDLLRKARIQAISN